MSELISEIDTESITQAWVVFRLRGEAPRVVYFTKELAMTEAERLAKIHHEKFFVARLFGSVKRSDVEWIFVGDDIPF